MRKLAPKTHHSHMKHKISIYITWKISDDIYERYSFRSAEKTMMARETEGIIIHGIRDQIGWDLYNNTHKNKIA